jgi:uncharacterized membrane protein YhaH (DUF805 family)
VTVRRLHDAGYSGWLFLATLIPWLGALILLIFALLPPSPAGTKYDPVPATSLIRTRPVPIRRGRIRLVPLR